MYLEIWGSKKEHWSGHGEYEPGVDPSLKPCPFCGGSAIVVDNTHTPFYSARCEDCGCEGPTAHPDGYDGGHIRSRIKARAAHEEAFRRAIVHWNRRFKQ